MRLTAEEILQRSIEVTGSPAAHAKIKTMVQKGTFALNGSTRKGSILAQFKNPSKARITQLLPNGHVVTQLFDGKHLWDKTGKLPAKRASKRVAQQFQMHSLLDSPLHEKEFYVHINIGGKETVLRHTTYVIRMTTKEGDTVLRYIDAKTFLPLRIDYIAHTPFGDIPTQTYLSNYKNIGGIQVPFKTQTLLSQGSVVTVLKEVKVNVPLSDSLFSPVAPPKIGFPKTTKF